MKKADNSKFRSGGTTNLRTDHNSLYENKHYVTSSKIKVNYTSTKEIEMIIKSLNSRNSSGYDEILVKVLKISITFISSPLTYL